ncbi:hypothetical protein [Microcella frigidaquae]|uniref:Uncharacterized protein n=1 Tax=Microcella frigidaquae TaxID=424758 RepID=A0A840XFV2_9MICO|nr:hypothetical protein [Microcella frigidaquae]MBB5617216.1 hypothetical protein [Microcella frigidaquae]NHN45083.1 hypothetical protein [Microcella frigidaquae]
MADRQLQNLDAPFWTHRQAALHLGFTTATIRKYIRQGLPTYLDGTLVKPREVVAHRIAARERQLKTLARDHNQF